jgi:hypothetical protein
VSLSLQAHVITVNFPVDKPATLSNLTDFSLGVFI